MFSYCPKVTLTTSGVQSTDRSGDETPHPKISSSSIKMFERSDPKIGRFDHEKPSKRNPLFLTEHSVNHSTAMLVSSLKITIY